MGLVPDKFEIRLSPEDRALVSRLVVLLEKIVGGEIVLKLGKQPTKE